RVPGDLVRSVRRTVASHVRGYRVIAGGRERRKLVPPRIPGFGKPVTEDDEGARALLGEMYADTVRLDRPMLDHLAVEPGGHQPASIVVAVVGTPVLHVRLPHRHDLLR